MRCVYRYIYIMPPKYLSGAFTNSTLGHCYRQGIIYLTPEGCKTVSTIIFSKGPKCNFEFFYLTISHVECVSVDSGTSNGAKSQTNIPIATKTSCFEVFCLLMISSAFLLKKCQALIIQVICENGWWDHAVLRELSPLGRHANGFMDRKQLSTIAYSVPCCCIYTPSTWWRHQMEIFSALLVLCEGNSPVTGEFPSQRPVTRSFDAFFDLLLNKQLSKQSRCRWFETPSRSLWHHCNEKTGGCFNVGYSPKRILKSNLAKSRSQGPVS